MVKWNIELGVIRLEENWEGIIDRTRTGTDSWVSDEVSMLEGLIEIEEEKGVYGRRIKASKNVAAFNLRKGTVVGYDFNEILSRIRERDRSDYIGIVGIEKFTGDSVSSYITTDPSIKIYPTKIINGVRVLTGPEWVKRREGMI